MKILKARELELDSDAVAARLEAITSRGKSDAASYAAAEEPLSARALKRLLKELGSSNRREQPRL
nr:hypothetical protein [Sphingomonas sp.]